MALAALSLASCSGSDDPKEETYEYSWWREPDGPEVMGQEWDLAKDDDVYIVGGCRRLFKNGKSYLLSDPRIRFGNSVFVSGDDVYVACDTYPPAFPGVPGETK
jgi:hypothetical protein